MLTTFTSDKEALLSLLQSIKTGKTQLPDFQRPWVWDEQHIRDLLASVSLSYPIGAVMMLETGNSEMRFKPRLVEGVGSTRLSEPERLILDGQQRLTSLFQSLLSGQSVLTKDARGKSIHRWYYLDIAKALDPNVDREDAIIGLPSDRIVRNFRGEVQADYSTIEKECEAELFPLSLVFDTTGLTTWTFKYVQIDPAKTQERFQRWNDVLPVIQSYQQYQIPIILLKKETPKIAVCQVFEKVNTGGVSLNVFELLTATYAAENFNLQEDWHLREKQLKQHPVLADLGNTDFLQAVTLLATRSRRNLELTNGMLLDKAPPVSCKRKDILKLTLADYKSWADSATQGFVKAAKLLHGQKILNVRDLPYQTQITGLAAIFAALGNKSEHVTVSDKLSRWYWCGVFGELYGSAIETRLAKDLPDVLSWIEGGSEPDTIIVANFTQTRLARLYTRRSAAYKGLSALLLRDNGCDFLTGYTIDTLLTHGDYIDIHHIFPRAWCRENGIKSEVYDSVINKTPLSSRTNKIIGGKAPSIYLARLQDKGISEERMNEILQSHVIDSAALRSDDFYVFFQARQSALLDRIEKAMGKAILREAVDLEETETSDYENETVVQES